MKNTSAIILAAGKGTRFKAKKSNKVTVKLKGKPIISRTVATLKSLSLKQIIVVIGFAAKSVQDALGKKVEYMTQQKQLGTGHALKTALSKINPKVKNLIVMYADDSFLYTPHLLKSLLNSHKKTGSDVTLLTIKLKNPTGIGRIIRNQQNQITGIVEHKNATLKQKQIQEVNAGLYCFNISFIKKYINHIKPNPVTHEYYLTDIIEVALKNNKKVNSLFWPDSSVWFGINTRDQLQLAQSQDL